MKDMSGVKKTLEDADKELRSANEVVNSIIAEIEKLKKRMIIYTVLEIILAAVVLAILYLICVILGW